MSILNSALKAEFLSEGLRLHEKVDLGRTSLAERVAMLFFHLCLKSSTGAVLAIV